MSDEEAPNQADLFLEHAMKDASLLASIKGGKWPDIEAAAKALNYSFTKQEFIDAVHEVAEDELEDEQLERISGGTTGDDDLDDALEVIGALGELGG